MGDMHPERAIASDRALARLAANQHGVVSLDQLRAIGISADAAKHRVRTGRLHGVHRGVYAVGYSRLSDEGKWKAAVLACGPGAALSHRSAAALWGLLPVCRGLIDVTVPSHGGRRKRAGIRLHRSTSLHPANTTLRRGIAVTTPARTLADLRRCVDSVQLGKPATRPRYTATGSAIKGPSNPTSPAASSSGGSCGCAAATAYPAPK